jgi:two-component system chemotaxis response regulator CheB
LAKRNVIVIGGSAGAVQPLTELLASIPEGAPVSLFATLHFSSLSAEWLSSHLRRSVKLEVRSPRRNIAVREGRVVLARPDHHLVVQKGRAIATRGPRENLWRPAIDVLFRSAAIAYGSRVIGVLLSGELDDGTAGLQAIKTCGGIAIVQRPQDAMSPAMPRTAQANVEIDYSTPLAELPALLLRLIGEEAPPQPQIPAQLKHEARMALAPEDSVALAARRGPPSSFSCPECGGPLWKSAEGGAEFRCLVGHAFHLHSLVRGADEELDRTLWAAIRLFEQRVNISRMLAEQERSLGQGHEARAELYDARARESREHAGNLRQLHMVRGALGPAAEHDDSDGDLDAERDTA